MGADHGGRPDEDEKHSTAMKAKLTDGRIVELQPDDFNPFGQIYLSKLVARGQTSLWDGASKRGDRIVKPHRLERTK